MSYKVIALIVCLKVVLAGSFASQSVSNDTYGTININQDQITLQYTIDSKQVTFILKSKVVAWIGIAFGDGVMIIININQMNNVDMFVVEVDSKNQAVVRDLYSTS